MTHERKGTLVALEGIDNGGKTTLLRAIKATFRTSHQVAVTRELTTWIGRTTKRRIRTLSSLDKILVFAADRLLRFEKQIAPALVAGHLCVADRWVASALAYRCAEDPDLEEYVRRVNAVFSIPDLTLLIAITPEESIRRGTPLRKNNYPVGFLAAVADQYDRMAKRGDVLRVDGMRPPALVRADVIRLIRQTISRKS